MCKIISVFILTNLLWAQTTNVKEISTYKALSQEPPAKYQLAENYEMLSCRIGKILNPSGREHNVQQQRRGYQKNIRSIKKWSDKLDMGFEYKNWLMNKIGSLTTSSKDFFVSDALVMNGDSAKNGNFLHALKSYKAEEFSKNKKKDFINDKDLYNKVKAHQGSKGRNFDSSAYSQIEDKNMAAFFKHLHSMEALASPLAEWIIQQPKHSISPVRLLEKASNIYGDPWVGLGVIGWITAWTVNSEGIPRSRGAVLASRMAPIYKQPNQDHAGALYHYWGYLTRILLNPLDYGRLSFVSFGYEMVYQNDPQDYYADYWGMRSAILANYIMTNHAGKSCDVLVPQTNNEELESDKSVH
ncbi:MAG: hypothetical protein KDD33_01330 [Bdellovibrionales bacterium]|nr:hypothetical protein [Bdellovibrionales bacterium]